MISAFLSMASSGLEGPYIPFQLNISNVWDLTNIVRKLRLYCYISRHISAPRSLDN
jgi:hypothetical protein